MRNPAEAIGKIKCYSKVHAATDVMLTTNVENTFTMMTSPIGMTGKINCEPKQHCCARRHAHNHSRKHFYRNGDGSCCSCQHFWYDFIRNALLQTVDLLTNILENPLTAIGMSNAELSKVVIARSNSDNPLSSANLSGENGRSRQFVGLFIIILICAVGFGLLFIAWIVGDVLLGRWRQRRVENQEVGITSWWRNKMGMRRLGADGTTGGIELNAMPAPTYHGGRRFTLDDEVGHFN